MHAVPAHTTNAPFKAIALFENAARTLIACVGVGLTVARPWDRVSPTERRNWFDVIARGANGVAPHGKRGAQVFLSPSLLLCVGTEAACVLAECSLILYQE